MERPQNIAAAPKMERWLTPDVKGVFERPAVDFTIHFEASIEQAVPLGGDSDQLATNAMTSKLRVALNLSHLERLTEAVALVEQDLKQLALDSPNLSNGLLKFVCFPFSHDH